MLPTLSVSAPWQLVLWARIIENIYVSVLGYLRKRVSVYLLVFIYTKFGVKHKIRWINLSPRYYSSFLSSVVISEWIDISMNVTIARHLWWSNCLFAKQKCRAGHWQEQPQTKKMFFCHIFINTEQIWPVFLLN